MCRPSFRFYGCLILSLIAGTAWCTSQDQPPQDRSQEQRDSANPGSDEGKRWRILVTNDDGIESSGLLQLVDTLSQQSDVVVCAPNANRSGASQSVPSLNAPMTVRDVKLPGAGLAVAVGGSPADAVCYAVLVLGKERPFDLVVSGINSSANVGDQSHSSGMDESSLQTCAASASSSNSL